MDIQYDNNLKGTSVLPVAAGWHLLIALSPGIFVNDRALAENCFQLTCHSEDAPATIISSRRGAFLFVSFDADSLDCVNPLNGALPAVVGYFLCALLDEKHKTLRSGTLAMLVRIISQEEPRDIVQVPFYALQKTYQFIESMRDGSADATSRKLPVAGRYFHPACRCLFDKTLKQLRYDSRLQQALDTLLHSDATIATIRKSAGYADARSFQKAFKHAFGYTPEMLRRY